MRYPDGHKEAVRAEIVRRAATALRRDGLNGVSIPALMKKAGLTHGGFYAHFSSRDELVAEAIAFAAEETGSTVLSDDGQSAATMLAAYVSKTHVDHPERGCVLAALGAEGPRQASPVRREFSKAARGFLTLVANKLKGPARSKAPSKSVGGAIAAHQDAHHSDAALRLAAQMVGAIVLARLLDDEALAERLLAAARVPD